jgi:P4 family phage/plasmid primase-like protien
MLAHRVEKGCDHTHTSFQRPSGAFYIPGAHNAEFLALYKAAHRRGEALHLTEHHRHIGPFISDLDFRYEFSAEEAAGGKPARRHDEGVVAEIVRIYAKGLAEFVETPEAFDVYVTEKSGATTFKGLVKDGLHLSAPGVVTRTCVQLLLRQAVLPKLAEAMRPLNLANRVEDVVDESIIERNNWMMYGSRKPQAEAYAVTRRYVYRPATGVLESAEVDPDMDYVELFSIRNKYVENRVRESRADTVTEFVAQQDEKRKRREAVQAVVGSSPNARHNTCVELEQVERLVELLDVARADSYNDWVRVGWCLRNIDHRLLDKWDEFSRRSQKYLEGECHRLWQYMRTGGLGIGTLHMWARHDSPERYREILRTSLSSLIETAISGLHHDVAMVVFNMYRYDYMCSSIRNHTWWEFRDHRWREVDSACSLRKRISSEVWKEFGAAISALNERGMATDDDNEQKALEDKAQKLGAVRTQLKKTFYKDSLIKECSELFYIEKLEDRLDSDCNLIGFENGVYDLERHEFREGRPDDFVSFSTGNNYVEYQPDHPVVRDIRRFWEQVLPHADIREYVMRTLASCLSGHTKHERFNIWTGSGSNGKSISVDLFERSFRGYCVKFPVTLLTQKRAASNAATSEIARAKGKRFGVLQEPSEDEKLNIGLMKELTGGDSIIARQLYREPVEFKPQFKMFLLCNHLPHVPSDDGGTWRRIRVVEFGSKFVEHPNPERAHEYPVDIELTQKLNSWKEHFMAILLDYYRRFAGVSVEEPEAVMQCTREYQRNNDHMADFVDSCLESVVDPNAVITIDEAFDELKDWIKNDAIPIRLPKKKEVQGYLDRNLATRHVVIGGRVSFRGYRVRDRYGTLANDDDDALN